MSTTNPGHRLLRLDMAAEVTDFVREIKALELASDTEELDFVIGRHVADVFSHLYDKTSACTMVEAYADDCVEGVYADKVGEDLNTPEADKAYRYGKAIVQLGISAFEKLNALGAYNSNDVLPYSFQDFLGRDVLMEYLSPDDGRK